MYLVKIVLFSRVLDSFSTRTLPGLYNRFFAVLKRATIENETLELVMLSLHSIYTLWVTHFDLDVAMAST